MKRWMLVIVALLGLHTGAAGAGLQTFFGSSGLSKIIYNGTVVMDATSNAGNGFTIWEYRLIAPNGSVQGGWGENSSGRFWDPSTNTLTWSYSWGTVKASYLQSGDNLTVAITVSNTDPSLTVEGLNIYPFYMKFPQLPVGFIDLHYPQIQFNINGPGILGADYGSGMVVMVNEDSTQPLYTGFSSTGSLSYHVLVGSTYNFGQATFWPKLVRPIPPGGSDNYKVSFRFSPSGTPVNGVAGDVYNSYRATWPNLINWPNRRPIGTLFLSTSGTGNDHQKAGFLSNPRRYFNDPSVNITTPNGLASFQQRVLAAAAYDVTNIQSMGGQGMITWDIEGQEYPQETSYVCDPQKLGQLAPEMESVLPNGLKLVDAYFKTFTDAGLKTGVCIRPQAFTVYPDGTAAQVYLDAGLSNEQQIVNTVAANLIQKIGYAKARWGVSIIYVDSAVNVSRGPLDAAVFRAVLKAYPDMLIIPEEHTPGHEAYSAGWKQPGSRSSEVRTTDDYKVVYPQAFSAIYVADAPVGVDGNLAQYDQYVEGVKGGDILLFRAFYQDTYYNGQVAKIYASAGQPTPAANPAILSFSASPTTVSAGGSTVLSWAVAGATSLSISPGPGTVAGSSVSVSPSATTTYTLTAVNSSGAVRASTAVIVVLPVKPRVISTSFANAASTPQSAGVNTAFSTALQATVKDTNNNPVSGVTVTFAAPGSGASASFGGSATATAVTNAAGVATAPALMANSQAGSYSVTASTSGVGTPASFSLTNLAFVANPVALVQQAAGSNLGNNQNTLTVTLGQAPASRNILVLMFDHVGASQTITSISGATWTRAGQNFTGTTGDLEIWVGMNPTSAAITITGTNYFGGFQPGYAIVAEFSGVSAVLDGPALNVVSGSWPATAGTLNTANAGDVLITSALSYSGGGVNATVSPSWTLLSPPVGTYSLAAGYQLVNTTGSYAATWNGSGTPRVATILLALKATGH